MTADPPTVRQGDDIDPPTRLQGGVEHDPPTRQQDGVSTGVPADQQPVADQDFPPELAPQYEPLGHVGQGGEGVVWRVRRRSDDVVLALKVHSERHPLDEELIAFIQQTASIAAYAPRIEATGKVMRPHGPVTWVAMEFLENGSLADLIAAEGASGGLAPDAIRAVVENLAAAVHAWQQAHRNPLDLKPSNLLIRRRRPLELVVGDFGGIVRLTVSQQHGSFMATLAYAPPEGLAGWQREPWPWWSLGEITYELLTGERRATENFKLVYTRLYGDELSKITDERWKLLLRGLLTRQPVDRWKYAEVRAWLDGESPPVIDEAHHGGSGTVHARSPIEFAGEDHHSPETLAAAMLDDHAAASRWLTDEGQVLFEWLSTELDDKRFPRHNYLRRLDSDPKRVQRALTAFTTTFSPAERPTYRGVPVDEKGLLALADKGAEGNRLLEEILADDILQIAARYDCPHSCKGRCDVLKRAGEELQEIVDQAEQRLREITFHLARVRHGRHAVRTTGLVDDAVRVTFRPDYRARLLESVLAISDAEPRWWRGLILDARDGDARPVESRGALLAATRLLDEARIAGEEIRAEQAAEQRRIRIEEERARAAQEAEERRIRAEQQAEERRLRAVRQAEERHRREVLDRAQRERVAMRRQRDETLCFGCVILIITAVVPILLGHLVWRPLLMHVTEKQPDSRVMGRATWLIPDLAFGTLVLLGLLGVSFLPPPWRNRRGWVSVGVVLVGASLFAPFVANKMTDNLRASGAETYRNGPITTKALGRTCGLGFLRRQPGDGAYWRYALVGEKGSLSCSEMVGYLGWKQVWRLRPRDGTIRYIGLFKDTLTAVQHQQGGSDELVGVNRLTGKTRWRWRCPHRRNIVAVRYQGVGAETDEVAHASLFAECEDGSAHHLAFTGKPDRT